MPNSTHGPLAVLDRCAPCLMNLQGRLTSHEDPHKSPDRQTHMAEAEGERERAEANISTGKRYLVLQPINQYAALLPVRTEGVFRGIDSVF